MSGYAADKAWSDRFIPAICEVVGPLLLKPAPLTVDQREATDLIVLEAQDMRIAARVRKHCYLSRWPDQFTIRSRRDSGAETELRKVIGGWADWMFYGFATADEDGALAAWRVLDLDVFRVYVGRMLWDHTLPPEIHNGDGTYFRAFGVESFPASLVLAAEGFRQAC